MNIKRYAIITTTSERDNIAAYLPSNYEVIYSEPSQVDYAREHWQSVVIAGEDVAGWGLDTYVLPRLASGMFHGKEIDLSHEIMQRVPAANLDTYVIAGGVDGEDGTLYWSNHDGWVHLSTATVFTEREHAELRLPLYEDAARWVRLPKWTRIPSENAETFCPNCGSARYVQGVCGDCGYDTDDDLQTPTGFDKCWIEAINGALKDREVERRIKDLDWALWDEFIGPMLDAIEREND